MSDEGNEERLDADAAADMEPLERLEARIVEIVEQLRESRRKLRATEEELAAVTRRLEERESDIERLSSERSGSDTERATIRKRIESLIERIESFEA